MLVKVSNPYNCLNNYFSVKNNLDKVMDSFFNDSTRSYYGTDRILRSSIVEKENNIVIFVEAPGFSKENIKIVLNEDIVSITAERKPETLDENSRWVRSERAFGSFNRSFQLPSRVNSSKVDADYKDGILKIELEKEAKVEPKEIDIKIK
jgi:HSP20 family protein